MACSDPCSMRLSKRAHLALCGCNELEQLLGPGVGSDQRTSVSVFPLTASGPFWRWSLAEGSLIPEKSYVTHCRRSEDSGRVAAAFGRLRTGSTGSRFRLLVAHCCLLSVQTNAVQLKSKYVYWGTKIVFLIIASCCFFLAKANTHMLLSSAKIQKSIQFQMG